MFYAANWLYLYHYTYVEHKSGLATAAAAATGNVRRIFSLFPAAVPLKLHPLFFCDGLSYVLGRRRGVHFCTRIPVFLFSCFVFVLTILFGSFRCVFALGTLTPHFSSYRSLTNSRVSPLFFVSSRSRFKRRPTPRPVDATFCASSTATPALTAARGATSTIRPSRTGTRRGIAFGRWRRASSYYVVALVSSDRIRIQFIVLGTLF